MENKMYKKKIKQEKKNLFLNLIKDIKNKFKNYIKFKYLLDNHYEYYNIIKNYNTYDEKKKNFLYRLIKSINNKKNKKLFDDFLKESYKNYVNTLEIEYSNLPFFISRCEREKERERYKERLKIIKQIIDSEKYKELIKYFNKEETFKIYKNICKNEKFTYEDSKELEFIDNMDYFNFIINKPLQQNFIQRKEFEVTEVNTK